MLKRFLIFVTWFLFLFSSFAYSQTNWGITAVLGSEVGWEACRIIGGTSPNTDNMVLTSVSMRVGSNHGAQIRLAVYQGGSLATGPTGATLIYDFGETSGSGTNEWVTLTHPGAGVSLTKNTVTWVAHKADEGMWTFVYSADSGDAGDFNDLEGRWNSEAVSDDEEAAFPGTWPADGSGSWDDYWISCYLTYEISASSYIPKVIIIR